MPPNLGVQVLDREISLLQTGQVPAVLASMGIGAPRSALFCNVHMLMLSRRDADLARAMSRADWVFADGVPVAWLQRRSTGRAAATLRGYEAMLALCQLAASRQQGIGLYGAGEETLGRLRARLQSRFPGLKVDFLHAPPRIDESFRESEEMLAKINASGIRFLFVALGCPKQEKWIDRHRERLNCSLLGVGAAFDWLAGDEPMVPARMERAGLGWLHRWLRHPVKLSGRYLVHNTQFLLLSGVALLKGRRP